MSIKHYSKGTGYTRKHRLRATRPTREEFESQVLPQLTGLGFEARLASLEAVCRTTIIDAGYTADERSEEFDLIPSRVKFQSHEWYAWQILNKISFVRAIRGRGDKREESGLLNFTLDLGGLMAEWEIKTRMRENPEKAHPPERTNSKYEVRRQAHARAVSRGLSGGDAIKAAADECGVSYKTIDRALKKVSV